MVGTTIQATDQVSAAFAEGHDVWAGHENQSACIVDFLHLSITLVMM